MASELSHAVFIPLGDDRTIKGLMSPLVTAISSVTLEPSSPSKVQTSCWSVVRAPSDTFSSFPLLDEENAAIGTVDTVTGERFSPVVSTAATVKL